MRCGIVGERVAVDLCSTVCSSIVRKMHKCASGGEIVERLCGRSSSPTFISRHIA